MSSRLIGLPPRFESITDFPECHNCYTNPPRDKHNSCDSHNEEVVHLVMSIPYWAWYVIIKILHFSDQLRQHLLYCLLCLLFLFLRNSSYFYFPFYIIIQPTLFETTFKLSHWANDCVFAPSMFSVPSPATVIVPAPLFLIE